MIWGRLLVGLLARPWARRVAGFALDALTIILFVLNLRRTAERAGRAAERLETLERADAIHRQMLDAAARRPRSRDDLLDRLRGVSSENLPAACPPVVDYTRAEQARIAQEVAELPEGAGIVDWLADYAVLRDQARACRARLA